MRFTSDLYFKMHLFIDLAIESKPSPLWLKNLKIFICTNNTSPQYKARFQAWYYRACDRFPFKSVLFYTRPKPHPCHQVHAERGVLKLILDTKSSNCVMKDTCIKQGYQTSMLLSSPVVILRPQNKISLTTKS